jgi:RNA polymerase sigma-70 factor (sigma-E family)
VVISASTTAAVPVPADDAADRDERIRALFEDHYAGLCRLAHLIVGDAAQAEELVMDAFVRTFVGWRRIRDLDKADRYLRRAVVNLSRSRNRRRHPEERSSLEGQPTMAFSLDIDPEVARVVWDAVHALPHRQRAAVVLRYYEDLPEADIADALGCSVGTVKSQLSKARATLARSLEGVER